MTIGTLWLVLSTIAIAFGIGAMVVSGVVFSIAVGRLMPLIRDTDRQIAELAATACSAADETDRSIRLIEARTTDLFAGLDRGAAPARGGFVRILQSITASVVALRLLRVLFGLRQRRRNKRNRRKHAA